MSRYISIIVMFLIFGVEIIFSQTTEINYKNWKSNCGFKTRFRTFIINNKNEFKEISNCNLLSFDFARYTIIGVKGMSSGHYKPNVDIRILKNDQKRKIIIEVILSGGKLCICRVMKPYYKRVIYTDKLNEDYEVEFNYIKLDKY